MLAANQTSDDYVVRGYQLLDIPTIIDQRGALSFVEYNQLLDFVIKRVYWLYDAKAARGGHAHKDLKQVIFCVHGSVNLELDDGLSSTSVTLDSPRKGLYIYEPLWRELNNFQNDPQIIVLASDIYRESDYIRVYKEFIEWKSPF